MHLNDLTPYTSLTLERVQTLINSGSIGRSHLGHQIIVGVLKVIKLEDFIKEEDTGRQRVKRQLIICNLISEIELCKARNKELLQRAYRAEKDGDDFGASCEYYEFLQNITFKFILWEGSPIYGELISGQSILGQVDLYTYKGEEFLTFKSVKHYRNTTLTKFENWYTQNTGYSSYQIYGGPSDGYGGYLTDDYMDDALGGDPSAYSID